jgi:hypothetical protein
VVTVAAPVVLILCVGLSASILISKHMAIETAGNITLVTYRLIMPLHLATKLHL